MADHDIFAVLTAYTGSSYIHFANDGNAQFFRQPSGTAPDISSRETTPVWDGQIAQYTWKDHHRLELRFSNSLKTPTKGWTFGSSSSSCDVKLDKLQGISRQHFCIKINEDSVPVLMDHGSTNGTAVSYSGQWTGQFRKPSNWVLAPPSSVDETNMEIVIHLPCKDYGLKIEFPNYDSKEPKYRANLKHFIDSLKSDLPELGALALLSTSTTALASPSTIDERGNLVYVRLETINHGSFAAVHKLFNPYSGLVLAAKQFNPPENNKSRENWGNMILNEVNIMKENAHPNIIRFIDFSFNPFPMLITPFYSLGRLAKDSITEEQGLTAFCQVLEVAKFLHSRKIIHRDIKPENILIESKEPFSIVVSDFGLSKQITKDMASTQCGTPIYIAPEVFLAQSTYDCHADIWSIAVVFLEIFWSIPGGPADVSQNAMRAWWKTLVDTIEDLEEDKVVDILRNMLNINVADRHSANQLLEQGVRNSLWHLDENTRRYVIV